MLLCLIRVPVDELVIAQRNKFCMNTKCAYKQS